MTVTDLIIFGFFIYFVFDGWRRGSLRVIFEIIIAIVAIVISLLLSLIIYQMLGDINFDQRLLKLYLFLIVWFLIQTGSTFVYAVIVKKLLSENKNNKFDKFFGIVLNVLKYYVFLLLVFSGTNLISPAQANNIKKSIVSDVLNSQTNKILKVADKPFENFLGNIFKKLYQNYFDIKNIDKKSIIGETQDLGFTYKEGKVDNRAEIELFRLVNEERQKNNLVTLSWNEELAQESRNYSQDMLFRGYFSHTSKSGKSLFDRLKEANISFSVAGENLALASDAKQAFEGLMNSPSHRANILSENFKTMGIGAINGGKYGIMFTQTFANSENKAFF